MKDLKYLLAYTVPLSAYVSFESTGVWTYSAVFYAFVVLPILDVLAGESVTNLDRETAEEKNRMWMFDLMLYANVPLVFGLMAFFFVQLQSHTYATFELVGLRFTICFCHFGHRGFLCLQVGFRFKYLSVYRGIVF